MSDQPTPLRVTYRVERADRDEPRAVDWVALTFVAELARARHYARQCERASALPVRIVRLTEEVVE